MVESGPASGFWGAAELGKLIGEPNVLALDIGGTTAKCSLIENGQVKIKTDYWIERDRKSAGYPIMVPVVDLVEIGNGGGSIAWVDDFGKLHVGPQSAGAVPGSGGLRPRRHQATTTDANLWLGRINRDYFCGGEIVADMEAAEAAIDAVGDKLGVDTDEAARGIVRIANNNMVNALKLVSLNRGHDPRDFTLVAFGGGGGMHAVALAAELGVKKVVVPRGRLGVLRLGHDDVATCGATISSPGSPISSRAPRPASRRSSPRPRRWRARNSPPKASRPNKVRLHALRQVPLSEPGAHDRGADRRRRRDRTRARRDRGGLPRTYEREYTYRLEAPVEIVGIHLVASAEVGKLTMRKREPQPARAGEAGARRAAATSITRSKACTTPRSTTATKLEPGMTSRARRSSRTPAPTIVVHPGNAVEIDGYGNIHITFELDGQRCQTDQRSHHARDHPELAAGDRRRNVRGDAKTAMSSIIYEVLDMGTGITDAEGELASSGAGIPGLHRRARQVGEGAGRKVRQAGRHRARRRLHHQRSLLRRRHASQRHRRRHAGIRRRPASSPGPPTSPTIPTSAA